MKMIVKLKAAFTARNGGACFPGDTIGVSRKVGKRLIANGSAVAVERRVEEVPRMTAVVVNVRDLRGDAKKDWLRAEIKKAGGIPEFDTIVALTEQLKARQIEASKILSRHGV